MKILDLCAAPGTKTIQLAELTNDNAHITATDISPSRLLKLDESIERLDIKSIKTMPYEEVKGQNDLYDLILLDVPCSNTGVLAKRPEVRLRLKDKSVHKLTETQDRLLETAAALLKPHGRICYSTCSILKEENRDRVDKFLKVHSSFEITQQKLSLPINEKFDHDGGYFAIMQKLG
jgi:16S rRNA (cytosine967-C5)-methyltransferase